ncbi:MAG: PQQ-dependent sugar dehydrogenase [Rhizonema sp. PD37]|nr:PQQ-dependent sugar dehydrogenase [Rhizonema sp. PD37]
MARKRFFSWRWLCIILFFTVTFSTIVSAQITQNPIPEPIEKSNLSVGLTEVVKIPDSGGDQPSAQLNLLAAAGDRTGRLFVNDTRGKLYLIADSSATVYMDFQSLIGAGFRGSQQGFSYFAFHPDFATNGRFYTVDAENKDSGTPDFPVTKTIFDRDNNIIESSHHDVIREWTASDPIANTFSGTNREIIRIEQPYGDHNVGQLAFNPNAKPGDADYGLLYIGTGDGGSDGFPVNRTDHLDNAQDLSTPLGKIIRIDPLGSNSTNGKYGIPGDNPFVNNGSANTLGEIWAYGLRNPHRFSWDTGGEGKMLIADIGQAFIEEVNLGKKGANYGWPNREGTFLTDRNNENVIFELLTNDADFNYTYPVAQYEHDKPQNTVGFYGIAIAGGFVYRGAAIPEFVGQYVFADFANDGRFFHVPVDNLIDGRQAQVKELRLFDGDTERTFLEIVGNPRSEARFGIDEQRELYVTSKSDGKVRKIVSSGGK